MKAAHARIALIAVFVALLAWYALWAAVALHVLLSGKGDGGDWYRLLLGSAGALLWWHMIRVEWSAGGVVDE